MNVYFSLFQFHSCCFHSNALAVLLFSHRRRRRTWNYYANIKWKYIQCERGGEAKPKNKWKIYVTYKFYAHLLFHFSFCFTRSHPLLCLFPPCRFKTILCNHFCSVAETFFLFSSFLLFFCRSYCALFRWSERMRMKNIL